MDLRKLQRLVVDALEDVKGIDIEVFDTTQLTDMFERVVLATGNSNRQTVALADRVVDYVKKASGDVLSVEGKETGEWVLVDLGQCIVHVMLPAMRASYRLEDLWGEKKVAMRTGARSTAAAKKLKAPAKPAAKKKTPAKKNPAAKKKVAAARGAAKKAVSGH